MRTAPTAMPAVAPVESLCGVGFPERCGVLALTERMEVRFWEAFASQSAGWTLKMERS